MSEWHDPSRNQRQLIRVSSGDHERYDKPVEIELSTDMQRLRLIEIDNAGRVLDQAVGLQQDDRQLIFLLKGTTPPRTTRLYYLYADPGRGEDDVSGAPALVSLADHVPHEGQDSYRIVTQNATYYYHKQGAGFASMLDNDGHDWLSFHPWGGSDGRFRGIPNLAHPEGYFHPGGTDCTSRIQAAGALRITLYSQASDGLWACRWDILPAYARLTVLRAANPYWFLYEGTPGGVLDESGDFMVRSDGECIPASESWSAPLPDPKWIYFGAANTPRVLYLVQHESHQEMDSYWPMQHNMTVFGFGRNGLEKYLTHTPARFTIGFAEDGSYDTTRKIIESAWQPLDVQPGAVERRAD